MSDQQWQVAGNAAQAYEQHLVPAIFAAWAPRVLALADPAPGERLLAEVETTLAPWQGPSGLAFPIGALLISAHV